MKIYCDFDGTITKYDLLDKIIISCYGEDYKIRNDQRIINGTLDHDKYVKETFEKLNINFETALQILGDPIEPSFKDFFYSCKSRGIDVYITSSGFKEFIKHFLPYVPNEQIYANNVNISGNVWKVKLWSVSKHDIIKDIHTDGDVIYIGDGISDFEMANHADKLFVKKNSDLEIYCKLKKINHQVFNSFIIINEKLREWAMYKT